MNRNTTNQTGWKPIPLPLKILAVVLLFWTLGSAMNVTNLMANGLPFFGVFIYGLAALIVVALLDFLGPLVFLFALWKRKSWGPAWAFTYLGIFILNGVVAFFTVRDQLGLPQILVPTVASILFLSVIAWQRNYFNAAD